MAIDSTLFVADLPAGSYNAGDIIPMKVHTGPASVRSGRGVAILKQILCARMQASGQPYFRVHVKNSDWIDEAISIAGSMQKETAFSDHSGLIQYGNDFTLTENSAWTVYAECLVSGTSTNADSIVALIDVDYPNVSSIVDPDSIIGSPTSIVFDKSITTAAFGSAETSKWDTWGVDYFKAGYQYCLQAVEMMCTTPSCGFVSFGNAAGMGGLSRIVPVNNAAASIRQKIRYASKLVKGPMDIRFLFFAGSSATENIVTIHDYVKKAA